MATDVKWIKIKIGLFDGTSFKRIKKAKIGGESFRDKLTAVWFELLDLGAKCNNDGLLYSDEIPYGSEEDIAIMIDRDVEEVKLCLQFYIANGMIEIVDNFYCLSNWSKYQNVNELEKIREQNRIRVARHRENKKIQTKNNVTLPVTDVTLHCNENALISYSNISNNNINIYNNIILYWNSLNIYNAVIINIKEDNKLLYSIIEETLKEKTEEEIKECMVRYDTVIKDKDYFFNTIWSLIDFLTLPNAINDFMPNGKKWINYKNFVNNQSEKDPSKWLQEFTKKCQINSL